MAEITGARTSSNIPAVLLRRSSRATQPYRKGGPRMPGQALTNMLRGRSVGGSNPADITRAAFLTKTAKRGRSRPARPTRPARPARPAR